MNRLPHLVFEGSAAMAVPLVRRSVLIARGSFFRLFAIIVLLGPGVAGIASAGGVRSTDGHQGEAIRALAIDPSSPDTVYAGTSGGAVFKSVDGGSSWNAVNAGLPGVLQASTAVTALVIDPSRPGTIYAARSGQTPDAGVFKSPNGGSTWGPFIAGLVYTSVMSLTIDPSSPDVLYAGTVNGGVYRSADGGVSWSYFSLNPAWDEGPEVKALIIDSSTLYAGTLGGLFIGNGTGLPYWTPSSAGLISTEIHVLAIQRVGVWDYGYPTLYAGTSGGVFKADDGRWSWRAINAGLTNAVVHALAVAAPGTLYAGTEGGVFKSVNDGESWTAASIGLANTDVRALAVDPSRPATVYAGTEGGGVFKSTNGGATWTSINRGYLDGPCVPDATTLCLSGGRFKVTAEWTTAAGQSGSGQAVALAGGDTGYFTFFDAGNVEVAVKVLNGCSANGSFWIFAGGLTDVGVVMTVTDSQTGIVKSYSNSPGTPFRPIQDTQTFATCSASSTAGVRSFSRSAGTPLLPPSVTESFDDRAVTCVADATTLCLNNSRYQVRAEWLTPDGNSGAGRVVSLTGDTGAFWFFSPGNIEVVVKILNGCGVDSRYWTFAGGLTDVQVVLTVTDMRTGAVRTYTNPQGIPFEPIQDTDAFAACP